jgi:hypothetical protein
MGLSDSDAALPLSPRALRTKMKKTLNNPI